MIWGKHFNVFAENKYRIQRLTVKKLKETLKVICVSIAQMRKLCRYTEQGAPKATPWQLLLGSRVRAIELDSLLLCANCVSQLKD